MFALFSRSGRVRLPPCHPGMWRQFNKNIQKNSLKIIKYPQKIRRLVWKFFKIRRFVEKFASLATLCSAILLIRSIILKLFVLTFDSTTTTHILLTIHSTQPSINLGGGTVFGGKKLDNASYLTVGGTTSIAFHTSSFSEHEIHVQSSQYFFS